MSIYAPKKPKRLNSLNVSIAIVTLVLGYLGWFYLPHWFKAWSMSGALVSVGRDAYRVYDDEVLRKKLLAEGRRIGLPVTPKSFLIKREPYSDAEISAMVRDKKDPWYMKNRGKSITIAFAVRVKADWPLTDDSTELEFSSQKTMDLTTVTY